MLANAGDVDAAADEYGRFIEFALKQGQVRRAADELAYGFAALGDVPNLQSAAAHLVPLGDVARALSGSVGRPNDPIELASLVPIPGARRSGNGRRHTEYSAPRPGPEATAPLASAVDLPAAFDEMASRIEAMGFRHIGFTSAVAGEGVSTNALGTALALARLRGAAVLLVDANWLRPALTVDAGLESAPGLADYLAQRADLLSVIRPARAARVAFLPIGDRAAATPTLPAITSFLTTDCTSFERVVVDLAPILAGEPFVTPWARSLDRLFMVVHEGVTQISVARHALSTIELCEAPDIVVNRATARSAPDGPAVRPMPAGAER
jgi:Mrp family chromosome partitioning ATPase